MEIVPQEERFEVNRPDVVDDVDGEVLIVPGHRHLLRASAGVAHGECWRAAGRG